MNLPNFLKRHKGIDRRNIKGSHGSFWRDPYIDWAVIIGFCFIFSFILIVISIDSYASMDRRISEQIPQNNSKPVAVVNTANLQRILKEFDARAKIREGLKQSYSGPSDPSF